MAEFTEMTELELLNALSEAKADALANTTEYTTKNTMLLERYEGMPYGDEEEGRSQVVSNDVQDVVESDMPSLARVFLGPGDVIKFTANTDDPREIQEAEEKTKYINWLVKGQPDSFRVNMTFLKDAEIQTVSVVKYFIESSERTATQRYANITEADLSELDQDFQSPDIKKVFVVNRTEPNEIGEFDVEFRITRSKECVRIINVPTENFLLSSDASCIEEAALVGDMGRKRRGDALAEGFDRDLIASLPTAPQEVNPQSNQDQVRRSDDGGDDEISITDWASEEVEWLDLYPMIDFDGDGIPERRHVIQSGQTIILNEAFDHEPYAATPSLFMGHRVTGSSRAALACPVARVKTVMKRQMNDNLYQVNFPQTAVNENVNVDDMLDRVLGGIIRVKGEVTPQASIMSQETPYIGDRVLQVLQHYDNDLAKTSGSMLANQGLSSDDFEKETATRFEGVQTEGKAKIELVARTIAEIGYRKLFDGLAWMVSNFQNTRTEIRVLGKALTVNPGAWRYDHSATVQVGLASGNTDQMVEAMQGILSIQNILGEKGSQIVDDVKIYRTLEKITRGLGIHEVGDHFNNPERPEELIQRENELLRSQLDLATQQLEQLQNPLAEAETIKAQAELVRAQTEDAIKIAQMQEDQRQFNASLAAQIAEAQEKTAAKLTELELKFNQDVPGSKV